MRRTGVGVLVALILGSAGGGFAEEKERSIHTVVGAGSVDGSSQIQKEVIEECIMRVPSLDQLRPVADSTSRFLKAINGDLDHNASVRTWSARIELTYVVHQKTLVVVTTNSVESTDPVFREVGGRFDRSILFESNPENGDMFHGRGLAKEYFFSSEEKAVADATRRARAWLEQKSAVLCSP
jgi:hypothetical protein